MLEQKEASGAIPRQGEHFINRFEETCTYVCCATTRYNIYIYVSPSFREQRDDGSACNVLPANKLLVIISSNGSTGYVSSRSDTSKTRGWN